MKVKFRILVFISLCACSAISFAQIPDTTVAFNPLLDDITQRIPQLEDLIDSALVHSPMLRYQDADIALWKYKIKTVSREWLRSFYLDAYLQNDIWNALTNNQTNYGYANTILFDQNSYRALASVSMRLPMDILWDRKNRMKTTTKEVEKSMALKENLILEIRKSVIIQYNTLIVTQRILKIANENIIANSMQQTMGDKEFLNGQMSLYELADINEKNRKAVTDFETSRVAFYNAYMILQEICGIKFNVVNKIE